MTIAASDQLLSSKEPVSQAIVLAPPAVPAPAVVLPLRERIFRFVRSLFVGAWASAFDFTVLMLCIRAFGLDSTIARVIALVASGVLLFFGSRSYAFHAQAGSISRQARLFVVTEFIGALLNLGAFRLLVTELPMVPPEAASQAANFLVFVTFYYPMRALVVFRVPRP